MYQLDIIQVLTLLCHNRNLLGKDRLLLFPKELESQLQTNIYSQLCNYLLLFQLDKIGQRGKVYILMDSLHQFYL